jgi:hypothetical protein
VNVRTNRETREDRGPYVTPEMAAARVKRVLPAIASITGGYMGPDEFIEITIADMERELAVLRAWHYLHSEMLGACRREDVLELAAVMFRTGGSAEDSVQKALPHIHTDSIG